MAIRKSFVFVILLLAVASCFAMSIFSQSNANDLFGDINGDGTVNSKDLSMLQRIILGAYETSPSPTPCPPKTAPHLSFKTIDEFVEWLETSPVNIHDNYYRSLITKIAQDGYILEPFYDNVSLDPNNEDSKIFALFDDNMFNEKYTGFVHPSTYSYRFFNDDLRAFVCMSAYDEPINPQAIAENPYNYLLSGGKYDPSPNNTLTPTAITVNLDGKQSPAVYYGQFDDNGHKYAEFINFLYEDASGSPVVVYASLYCDYSNVDIFEFVSKLSFEHVPVNRTIEE